MLYTSILLPLLAAVSLSSAAPHERRAVITANTIVTDILGIDTGVNNLRTGIAGYTGGLLSETPIIPAFAQIEVANRKGYADANLASPFSASGSIQIVQSVQNTVAVDIPAAIKELEAKKALFVAAGQQQVVVASLKVLLYDHDSFSAAVAPKLTADQTAATAGIAVIHNAIQDGIDYFST